MEIRRLPAASVKRDRLYKFVCVDPKELAELEARLEALQKAAPNIEYKQSIVCPSCPNCGKWLNLTLEIAD